MNAEQLEHFPFPVCADPEKGIQNREMDEIQAAIGWDVLLEKLRAGDGESLFALGRVYRIVRDRADEGMVYLLPQRDDRMTEAGYLTALMQRNAGMMMELDALDRDELPDSARQHFIRLRHYFERQLRLTENAGLARGKSFGEVRSIHIGSLIRETLERILYYLPGKNLTVHEAGEIRFVCNPEKIETILYILIAECLSLSEPDAKIGFDVSIGLRLTVAMTVEGISQGELLEKNLFESETGNPAYDALRRLIRDSKGSFFVRRGENRFTLVMRFLDQEDMAGRMMNVDRGLDAYSYARLQLSELLEDKAFAEKP